MNRGIYFVGGASASGKSTCTARLAGEVGGILEMILSHGKHWLAARYRPTALANRLRRTPERYLFDSGSGPAGGGWRPNWPTKIP